MFWLQCGLKNRVHPIGMNVNGVWITDGKLVIDPGVEYDKKEILLSNIEFLNLEEMITEVEVKELELHNKIVDLIGDLTAESEKYQKIRDEWQENKDVEMYNYYQGCKNAVDLCIVKLKTAIGFYNKIEEGGKL